MLNIFKWGFIFFIASFSSFSYSQDFIPAEEAFVLHINKNAVITSSEEEFYDFTWNIKPDYYLYEDKIKITANNEQINLKLPKYILKDDPTFGTVGVYYNSLNTKINSKELTDKNITVHWQGCSDKGLCYQPQEFTFKLEDYIDNLNIHSNMKLNTESNGDSDFNELITNNKNLLKTLTNNSNNNFSSGKYDFLPEKSTTPSLLNINSNDKNEGTVVPTEQNDQNTTWLKLNIEHHFSITLLIALLLGVGLSFTPCVLPMIPIMATVILEKNTTKAHNLILLISFLIPMILIYSLIGLAVSLLGASVQAFLQSFWIISFISIFFVLLSFSMFGFYQIQLPERFRNKLNNIQVKEPSILSSMVLGTISAIISSPCVTAPLASVFLYVAQLGNPALGFSLLLSLSIGMSIPLLLFGLFGKKALPKSGNWLNIIKNSMGYIMLFMSVYMIDKINTELAIIFLNIILLSISIILYQISKNKDIIKQHFLLLISITILITNVSILYNNTSIFLNNNKEVILDNSLKDIKTLEEVKNILSKDSENLNKRNIFYFTADWCVSCRLIEKNVLTQNTMNKLGDNISLIKIDITDPNNDMKEFMKKLNVFGPPTLVELTPELKLIKKHPGVFSNEELLSF